MSHTPNMYGSNLKEYAQNVLDNKQIAVSTRAEWNMLIKRLHGSKNINNYLFLFSVILNII